MVNPFTALTSKIFGSVALALLMLVGFQSCKIDRIEGQRDKAVKLAKDEKTAHETTVTNYRAAALIAERIQADNLTRAASERAAIDERKINDLQAARDTADARYRRLLATAAKADTGSASDPDLSAFADATCRAYAGTGCNELPARLKAAQDNTDQLIALQGWAREQAGVRTSPILAEK